ncbi:hypothetical protein Tco_1488360, partial [Tanacetum coccineum]
KEYLGSGFPDAFQKVLQSHTEELKKELSKKKDYKDIIEESVHANEALEKTPHSLGQSSSQGQSTIQAAESLSEYELKKILYAKMHKSQSNLTYETHQELFDALTWSMLLDEANMQKGNKPDTFLKKRDRGDDKDEDLSAGSNQDEVEQIFDDEMDISSQSTHTAADVSQADTDPKIPKKGLPWLNEMIQAQKPPLMFDELMSTPIDFSAFAMNRLKLNNIIRAYLEFYRVLTDQLDWVNLEGHKSPVDMSKPLPLQDKEGRLVIPVEFFFNNDLEYLRAGNKERTYSSSTTKTPAERYTMEGIEDMISTVWSLVEKRSRYGYLKEIVVRRADQKLYKFKEDRDVIVDFITALKMFTRGIVVKNKVEDVQLGVISYHRKLNLTKPQRTCQHISVKEPYTPNYDPPGINYEEKTDAS